MLTAKSQQNLLLTATDRPSRIVCCTPFVREGWTWFSEELDDRPRQWFFYHDQCQGWLEKAFPSLHLAQIRACWQAVLAIKQQQADLLVTFNASMTVLCCLFSALLRIRVKHVGYTLDFATLPRGINWGVMKWALSQTQLCTVHSMAAKHTYSTYFNLPTEQFKVILWGMATPVVYPEVPLLVGNYICAIGDSGRDYQTLMFALAQLPDIPTVIVAKPQTLKGIRIPPNVQVLFDTPLPQAMNILKHSRFMVLPLQGERVLSGYKTLVAAMQLGKAAIVTHAGGVLDYALNHINAVICSPFNAEELARAIYALWHDPSQCEQLGNSGRQFARKHCSEASARRYVQQCLASQDL